jgi:hypothetical protein
MTEGFSLNHSPSFPGIVGVQAWEKPGHLSPVSSVRLTIPNLQFSRFEPHGSPVHPQEYAEEKWQKEPSSPRHDEPQTHDETAQIKGVTEMSIGPCDRQGPVLVDRAGSHGPQGHAREG